MCTLILLRRPGTRWPLLLAANRDEHRARPWLPPARHWPDRSEVVAGRDLHSGGSWLGVNDHGVVAAILNRVGTLGPAPDKRSRGELVLDALDYPDAATAAEMLRDIDPEAYRPFNLVVADAEDAFWLRHAGRLPDFAFRTRHGAWREVEAIRLPQGEAAAGTGRRPAPAVEVHPVLDGLSMITARDLNDVTSARLAHYLPRLRAAPEPDPEAGDWDAWIALLASRESPSGDPTDAMTIETGGDYGTVCASLIALPEEGPPRMLFAPGRPDVTPFAPVPV